METVRFGDKIIHTSGQATVPVFLHCIGSQGDNGCITARGTHFPHPGRRGIAIHDRHIDIHKNEFRCLHGDKLQCLTPVGSLDHIQTHFAAYFSNQQHIHGIVFGDKNGGSLPDGLYGTNT
jgi:hypothetical protein